MPQLIVIAVILSVFDEHVNDFLDPIKKHILKKKFMNDKHTVSLWRRRVETFTVKLDDIMNWFLNIQFIVLPKCYHDSCISFWPGGALLNYLRKQGKTLSKKQLTKMCEDAASGMAYLESKNCIHR